MNRVPEFVKTKRGGQKLIINGYLYRVNVVANAVTYYKCDNSGCRGPSVHIENGLIINQKNVQPEYHHHGDRTADIVALQLIADRKLRAAHKQLTSVKKIYSLKDPTCDLEPSRSAAGSESLSCDLPVSAVPAEQLPPTRAPVYAQQVPQRNSQIPKAQPVCRLCMKAAGTSQQMVLIFKDVHASESLVDKIQAVTGLVMVEGDGLPLQICQPCFKRINDWFSYKQLCYSSDTKFRALAAAMETEPPGHLFMLNAKGAAKRQYQKTKKTKTSTETRAAEESPEVETRLIRVKEEVQEYPSEQLDSEECSGNDTLPFENVNVKLECEELRQFATTSANEEDSESFEEPTIKLEISENDIDTSSGDPLASETIESGTLSPEPLSRIVPSAPRVPLCPSLRPSAVPCGSLDQLSAPEVPGDAPAASRSVLSCGTNPTVLLPPTPETALRDLSDLKRQASHQLIPTATENPSKRQKTDI